MFAARFCNYSESQGCDAARLASNSLMESAF